MFFFIGVTDSKRSQLPCKKQFHLYRQSPSQNFVADTYLSSPPMYGVFWVNVDQFLDPANSNDSLVMFVAKILLTVIKTYNLDTIDLITCLYKRLNPHLYRQPSYNFRKFSIAHLSYPAISVYLLRGVHSESHALLYLP